MKDIPVIDVRGLSCPEPVIITKRYLDNIKTGKVVVLADSGASRDNVTRMAKNNGWQVRIENDGGEYRLEISKE